MYSLRGAFDGLGVGWGSIGLSWVLAAGATSVGWRIIAKGNGNGTMRCTMTRGNLLLIYAARGGIGVGAEGVFEPAPEVAGC